MSAPQVSGERMATVIPFPLDRVRQSSGVRNHDEARVVELPVFNSSFEPMSEDIPKASSTRRAHNISMYSLAKRGMSRKEIESLLLSRGLDHETVADEIQSLTDSGLIDDRALAVELVDKYHTRASLGARAVISKLRSRGIPESLIEEAMSIVSESAEDDAMRRLAEKKLSLLSLEEKDAKTRKLGGFLLRKGYSPERVYELVRELVG